MENQQKIIKDRPTKYHENDHFSFYFSEDGLLDEFEKVPEIKVLKNFFEDRLISLENKINSFVARFCDSFTRWISLYKAARSMIVKSRITLDDPVIMADNPLKSDAKRQHAVGLKQIELLINDTNGANNNQSEFYIFRYLAAEGFLPGYNFTRLPVRTFVGYKHNDQGEYLSRPRAIALKEFVPFNTLYHNGNKYRINRMMLLEADNLQRKIKISKETGYAFLNE
jgi:hypothetical protein